MKKKGFTLIELLGVMVLLGVIFAIAYPNVLSSLQKSKENSIKEFETNLFLATEAYINDNEFEELNSVNGRAFIMLDDLLKGDYINASTVDGRTKKKLSEEYDYSVQVTVNSDKTFSYKFLRTGIDYSTTGYVNNGLVLHYDGYTAPVNNGTNVVWKDLSGNNNDGVIYGNDLTNRFIGNGVFMDSSKLNYILSKDPIKNNTNFTVQILYKPLHNEESVWGDLISFYISGGGSTTNADRLELTNLTTGNYMWFSERGGIIPNGTQFSFENNKTALLTLNAASSSTDVYKNSDVIKSVTPSGVTPGSDNIYFAARYANFEPFNCNIYAVRIYNRALTDAEIKQNYEIDKVRFDIE